MTTPNKNHASNDTATPSQTMEVVDRRAFERGLEKMMRVMESSAMSPPPPPGGERRLTSVARGELTIFDPPVQCHVLDDGRRVVSGQGVMSALNGSVTENRMLRRFLEKIASDSGGFKVEPISFVAQGGVHHGITAGDFQRLLSAVVDLAFGAPVHAARRHIVENARRMEKALVGVALVALVDEATGYQLDRAPNALARLFREYLLDEHGAWAPEFPEALYVELGRVYRYDYTAGQNSRPAFFKSWTWRYVYTFLPDEVRSELRSRNPDNAQRHHQHLTPVAKQILRTHFIRLVTVLRQSTTPKDFHRRFEREFGGGGLQFDLAGIC